MKFKLVLILVLVFVEACTGSSNNSQSQHDNTLSNKTSLTENGAPSRTKSGAQFIRDSSNPRLGEAWVDPIGLVWGNGVKNDDGTIKKMDGYEAEKYCASVSARLPSLEDFIRLGSYFGNEPYSSEGYTPQILPDLENTYWTTPLDSQGWLANGFNGKNGSHSPFQRDFYQYAVRCVSDSIAPSFVTVYTDNTRKIAWGRRLPGKYSNGCADSSENFDKKYCSFEYLQEDGKRIVKIADSKAAKSCKDIGARLPSKDDFVSLINNFEHYTSASYDTPSLSIQNAV